MAKLAPIAGAIVVGLVLLPNAGKAAPDDVAALRAELEALKTDYTSRVQAEAAGTPAAREPLRAARAARSQRRFPAV